MFSNRTCASVSNSSGSLLFYTNGSIIYDQTHTVMANGTGLSGSPNGSNLSQGAIIIKKPGSASIYYVFTTYWVNASAPGLFYSVVDMSLASGNGSVTVKNVSLAITPGTTDVGRLTATPHCNGTDIWFVAQDWNHSNSVTSTGTVSSVFRSFLVSSSGVNPTPVLSSPSTYTYSTNFGWWTCNWGAMKISPNGKKLGVALGGNNTLNTISNYNCFEMYDFDNTSGVVSNSVALKPITVYVNTATNTLTIDHGYGCEFSPDGTKFMEPILMPYYKQGQFINGIFVLVLLVP